MKKFLLNWLFFWIGFFFIIWVAFLFVNASNLSKSEGDTLSRANRNELVSRVEILESYHVENYTCTGSIPSNATLCNGDDSWLSSSTTMAVVASCTDDKKCEYKCNSWTSKSGNSCINTPSRCMEWDKKVWHNWSYYCCPNQIPASNIEMECDPV